MSPKNQNGILMKSAEITNFRGIKECKIDDLSLVNIFVGVNNSGKSTLLDAIYLGCKEPILPSLYQVVRERVQRTVRPYELFFGYNKNSTAKVILNYNTGHKYALSFFLAKEDLKGHGAVVERGTLAAYFECGTEALYITTYNSDLIKQKEYESFPSSITEIRNYPNRALLFPSTIKKDQLTTQLDTQLSEIKFYNELEDDLNRIMTDIYEDFEYEFIPNPENHKDRRVAFKEGRYRILSDFHGDGKQRALGFLTNLELYKDTAIFIEEIEMFQHPRALRKLAKYLIELAKKNRVQLFISTHSYYDVLRFFYHAFEEEQRKELFRCYVVTRNNGVVNAKLDNNVQNIIDELYKDE